MKHFYLLTFLSQFLIHNTYSQDTITYSIHFPNAVHHEAEINLMLRNIVENAVTAVMSKTSPGRYAVHDFGKNIYNLNASDSEDTKIEILKTKPDEWEISGINSDLHLSYTLYANRADGTYSGIDAEFANLNIPSSLIWIKGMEQNPVKVIFHLPDTNQWKIATQLLVLDSARQVYAAPNLEYLMDSPCMLSDFSLKELEKDQMDGFSIRMAIKSDVKEGDINRFAEMTSAVIHEQKVIFGEFPTFMDSTYTFLCSYGPGFHGDGMEHRNSTMISSEIPLTGNLETMIGTISHEFFHAWNMERIRPASLEPFDFTQPNVSGELWFGEGFTSYYEDLTLCRSGLMDKDRYLNRLGMKINYLINAPGWKYGSPVEMSEMAAYTDESSSIDESNFANTFLSYYVYGELIGLAMDLSLRTEFEGISLDDLMKAMWVKYGKEEKPFTNQDLMNTLAEVCGDSEFAADFFEDYIFGNELPDYESLFDQFGYKLVRKNPGRTSIGFVRLSFDGDTATLLSQPLVESALYEAGVNKGDLILSIDDQPVTSYPELNFIIGTRKIDDEIDIEYSHLGKMKQGSFKLKEDNQFVLIPKERFSMRTSEEEEQRKEDWLRSRVIEN